MNTENSKRNEPLKFVLNTSQRLDLKKWTKNVALITPGKNIRKQYKNNKLKIIASTWNIEFELHRWFLFSVRY